MSAVGNLQVSQVVDPLKTVRFSMPNQILASYGVELGADAVKKVKPKRVSIV